jgi:hypothetical protein
MLKTYIEQTGQAGKGAECAMYQRDASGIIARTGHRINGNHNATQYLYEEKLISWPEKRVFWVDATGPTIGAAPVAF